MIADDESRTAKVVLRQTLVNLPLPPFAICKVDLECYHSVAQQQFFTSEILLQHAIESSLIKDRDIPPTQFYKLETPVRQRPQSTAVIPGETTGNFPSPQGPRCGTKGNLFQMVRNKHPLLDVRSTER